MVLYNKAMHLLQKLGRGLSSSLLKLGLYFFAITFALVSVVGTPDNIKQNLWQNGVYESAVDGVLDAASNAQQESEDQTDALPLDDPEIRQAAKAALPTETVELWIGQLVDGLYGWLDGATPQPEFQIDTTDQRQALANNVADVASRRIENLRPCTQQEAFQLAQQNNIDLFNLPCRPPIDLAGEKQRLTNEIENNQDLFGSPIISSADLIPAGSQEKNFFRDSSAPDVFQWIKRLPIIAAAISLVSVAALLWLADSKRRGFKKTGLIFLGSGLFLIISTLLFNYLFNRANQPGESLNNLSGVQDGGLQTALLGTARSLFGTFNAKVIFIALIYVVIGLVVLIILHLRRADSHPATEIKA